MELDGLRSRVIEETGRPEPTCPKHMVYGPCGGVRVDERCEVDDRPCPFVHAPTVRWTGPPPPRSTATTTATIGEVLGRPPGEPIIITDLRVRPFDRRSIEHVTATLSAASDAVLVGEHHTRPDFPPTLMAAIIAEAGGRAWVTLTCRDRNRVVLESELAGLAAINAAGVHCVTGDARAPSVRDDATQVFDLDSTRLVALARHTGMFVSVAATPTAPPLDQRPRRLGEKVRAGAQACFVNHAGGSAGVARFATAVRRAGVDVALIPCVAVFTDVESLLVLERFPGLVVDPDTRRAVLDARDGRSTGMTAAIAEAERMLAIDGVVGINLSGSATSGSETDSAAIMADISVELRLRRVSRSR